MAARVIPPSYVRPLGDIDNRNVPYPYRTEKKADSLCKKLFIAFSIVVSCSMLGSGIGAPIGGVGAGVGAAVGLIVGLALASYYLYKNRNPAA